MDSSQLFPLLKSLSVDKRPSLFHFLGSAYCNPSIHADRQIRLVQTIFESLDTSASDLPDNPKLFFNVFGNRQYDNKKLEKLRSVTLLQIKRFMADEYRKESEPEVLEQLRFAAFIRTSGQYALFSSEIKKIEKQIHKMPDSIEKMYCIFMKEYEIGYLKSIENNKKDDSNIPKIVSALDHFYLSHRLHYELSFRQQQQFSNLIKNNELFDMFPLQTYQQLHENKPVLIDLYVQLNHFFRNNLEDQRTASAILDFMRENESLLSRHVLRESLTCLINYYTKLINQGKSEYYDLLFTLQKTSVEKGYIYYMDKIHAADFQAIVTIALRLNELDWTWEFITANKNKILNKKQCVEMLRYIHACYYFQKRNYTDTARYLKETFEELQFKTASRILELKLLYETRHPDLKKKLNAAKVYFYRDITLPPVKKIAANKFVDYIKQILIPGTFNNKSRLDKVIGKLKEEPSVAEKPWLLEILSGKRTILL